jgi:TolA-binding protein
MKTTKKILRVLLKSTFLMALFTGLVITSVSCQNMDGDKKESDKKEMKEDVEEAVESTKTYLSNEQQEIVDKFEARIDEADKNINELQDKMAEASGDVKQKLQERIDELKNQRNKAQKKLDELSQTTEEAWEDVKEGADEAFDELDQAIDDAKKEFK